MARNKINWGIFDLVKLYRRGTPLVKIFASCVLMIFLWIITEIDLFLALGLFGIALYIIYFVLYYLKEGP